MERNTLYTKHQSSPIWNRFKKACDHFFSSRKEYYNNLEKKENNLKIKNKHC